MSDTDYPPSKRHRSQEDVSVESTKLDSKGKANVQAGTTCPYMHTINRAVLDFDFEKVCSVCLESHNVYACLVCGKYFQGRGPDSHAYAHALDVGHHMFLNLTTERTYCLPDGYSVVDPALDEIAFALHPKFSQEDIDELDIKPRAYRLLDGTPHLQGVTGMDNLHASDYANVICQMLFTVSPVRNFLLLAPKLLDDPMSNPGNNTGRVFHELCALAQKVWSPAAFRGHVSPHELMQEVSNASARRFSSLHQSNPVEFFAWLIHSLHRDISRMCKSKALKDVPGKNLLKDCFQGSLEVTSVRDGDDMMTTKRAIAKNTFWFLSLDLPPKPLFKDTSERTLVTQVPLKELLAKYDGKSQHHIVKTGERRSYKLLRLPPYLLLTINRVTRSKFSVEKNSAVVHCPMSDLDLSEIYPFSPSESKLYHLSAMVIHDGPHDTGTFRVVARHRATNKWFSIQNMNVSEVLPQLVSLSDTWILLYEQTS